MRRCQIFALRHLVLPRKVGVFGWCFYHITSGPKWNGQCVQDKRARELPVDFGKSSSNDPEYCIKKCKSHEYSYAGVQYSKECFCGNTPPSEDAIIDDKKCNRKCPGDSSKMCGASWKMNVYETGG